DPARGHQPHSGAGPGPAGSVAAEGRHRHHRQARLPHGRPDHDARAGGREPSAAGFGFTRRRRRPEIPDREARAGFRRRPHRRPAGLRPAHQRADRQLPLQFLGRPQVRRRDAGQCRQAVRHRARQQGDLGSGHPRTDPRRFRADFREFHRSAGQRSLHPLARRRLAGALTIVEERTVGPGLGQDSINAGEHAAYVGAALVVFFMLVTYGLFGLFANIAVAVNVAMIFGVLSMLNATLTLPGIAGIVLTVGIAVDSNVLIYERIREEVRGGRTAINAIDAGFSRALATILDSNITTFIAAAVLFYIGTGPVRGFAVTLGIGILTSLFTAFTLTRLIVAYWVRLWRPRTVPI